MKDSKHKTKHSKHSTYKKSGKMSLYSNLVHKKRTKKDLLSRKRAEYLASLPKHPVKRFFAKMHPKRVLAFWLSRRGMFLALKLVGVMILVGIIMIAGVFAYFRQDLESIRPENLAERVQTTVNTYYDRNGVLLWEDKGADTYRLTVESDEITEDMKNATVAIEDRQFYEHEGFSLTGMLRSAVNNVTGGPVQGGSTLTQQLVKQVFLADEASDRSLGGIPRKIKELILAIEVERMYTKEQILTLYLNESPYGGRRNGVESAAQTYFGKSAKDLNLAESAMLAAIPNQPGLYDPYNTAGHEALINRQHKTLNDMVEMGVITPEEAEKAKEYPILDTVKPLQDQLKDIKAPHFVLMVRDQLEEELGEAIVGRGGLTIKTTLDYRIQKKAQESMNNMFASGTPEYAGFTNGATTVEDVKTGQIIALVGSRNFSYKGFGQHNAAVSYIQPGSTIKPLVFAELFDNNNSELTFGSGSILSDEDDMEEIYGAPLRNADGTYKGKINIRNSLALSRNVPAVKAMHIAGVQETLTTIRELGDTGYCTQGVEATAGLASSIGGCGTRQIDHVNAFASLARGGVHMSQSSVIEVKNNDGEVLKSYQENSKQVIDAQAAYIVSDILSDDNARAGLYGTNRYGLVVPGVKTAAKTGTSDIGGQAKDIWTMSYSPVLAMGVWLGNSDTTPLINGNSSIPAQIVGDVMSYAHTEIYAKEGKWSYGDWIKQPAGIQVINGELYPSYHNNQNNLKKETITFDKVSKKKATNCTPEGAKVEKEVRIVYDPIKKEDTYLNTDGYDPTEEDDIHKCDDVKPKVSLSVSADGKSITVNYTKGTAYLTGITVKVNGTAIANLSPTGSGSKTVANTVDLGSSFTATAEVTDRRYYTNSSSATWKATASSATDDSEGDSSSGTGSP